MDTRLITHRGFAARSDARSGTAMDVWGLPDRHDDREPLLLSAGARRHERDLSPADVRRLLLHDPSELAEVLPTFGAAVVTPSGGVRVATDHLGFRHVFHAQRPGAAVVSTSSHACAVELGSGLDLDAVAVQSSLGLAARPAHAVRGRRQGRTRWRRDAGGRHARPDVCPRTTVPSGLDLDHAVRVAADVLRTYLTAYLEDHPDAGLQLTGGQDSRLLLSAVPPARRRGLRVVTLGAAGEPDVDIAADLAARYGMRHELLSLTGLEEVHPAEAWALCLDAARRLDFSADPVAHAVLTWAEARSEPGPRISGLGGEVSRGFYYLGLPTSAPVSAKRARRLAEWRMFVNEAVPAEALHPAFGPWARERATQEVVHALTESGRRWMAATDHLYLHHRMQRWAGVTETAVCLDRQVVNPMLDDRFIAIATALDPLDKRSSRFLGRLQLALDDELGSIPMDGRPAPAAYAHRSARNSARQTAATVAKARGKVLQRLRGETRPPAGGEVLAAKVVEHWRAEPSVLEPLHGLGVFADPWLDSVTAREAPLPPSSAVALAVNLVAALHRG